jgi:ribonucleoside-diphosphate reductase alpha subunit
MTHGDIEDFILKNSSRAQNKTINLFYGLWISDLFMKCVDEKKEWYCFGVKENKKLTSIYGKEYEELYHRYVKEKRYIHVLDARKLMNIILEVKKETGQPFLLFKDHANSLSNQKHKGIIRSSNLCTEIFLNTENNETATCNLASINLAKCCKDGYFDYDKLGELTCQLVRNLNRIIDNTLYVTEFSKILNLKNRPMGIGVQGLADALFILKLPFASEGALNFSKKISETMYYNAIKESCQLAKEECAYDNFFGSPLQRGKFHFDMYEDLSGNKVKLEYDWDTLRKDVMLNGVRNSQFIAFMPTASTANICDNFECFEPAPDIIFNKKISTRKFICYNKYFIELCKEKRFDLEKTFDTVINESSVKSLNLSELEKSIYRTAFEIPLEEQVAMTSVRTPFIDQGQSFSLSIENPSKERLGEIIFKIWRLKFKTGMYYLRIKKSSNECRSLNECRSCT